MSFQDNSEASPDATAGGRPRGSLLGERTAGLPGNRVLPDDPPLSLAPARRPGSQTADRGDRGAPNRIQCDNGTELISRALDKWAYENGVTLDFSRPGKPMDNATIESFNGSFRDECLNVNWFLSMEDAQEKIEKWRLD